MSELHQLLTLLNELAKVIPWDAVVYAPIASIMLLSIKKLRNIDNGEVMQILLLVISAIPNIVDYLVHTPSQDPSFIAIKGLITALASQPFYFLVVKPALSYFSGEMQKALDNTAEIKSAAVPAAGLAIGSSATTTSIPVQDFKD